MKNLTVAMKLGLGFGVVLLLLMLTAVMGLRGMSQVNSQLDDIVNDNVYKMSLVTSMSESVHIVSRVIRTVVLLDDEAAIKQEIEKIEKARDTYNKAWDALEKTVASERGLEIRRDIKEAAAAAREMNGKVLDLALANKDEEARDMLMNVAAPLVTKWQAALDVNAEFQATNNKKQAEDAMLAYESTRNLMITVVGIAILLGAIIAFFITRGLVSALGGEPGFAAEVASRVADGDLTVQIPVKQGDTSSMLAAMKTMAEKLSQIISEVNSAATNIASASEEVSSTAQSMSQATNEQAASVEQTSAAVEEMGASINQNTENAKITEGIAANAAKDANEGGEAVSQTVEAMKQIADKISIIDDIAYQTNLLALNAAIEAARAGEHGRGFAVVAAEVRKLAERSQVAAQEIGEVAKSSVGLAEKAGHLLEEMVPNINKTSDLVQEITAASEEQSNGAGQITSAINQLNQITQQNASSSEELAATAEEMSASAEQLQGLMSFFKLNDSTAGYASPATSAKPAAKKAAKPVKVKLDKGSDVNESEFVKF